MDPMEPTPSPTRQDNPGRVVSFASAKGGLGTTMLAANLGIQLAKKGRRVLLVDAALTEATCHLALGMEHPERNLGSLVHKEVQEVGEAIVEAPVNNLALLAGAPDDPEVANMAYLLKQKIIQSFRELPFDYILVDSGVGTGSGTHSFLLAAEYPVLVCQPNAPSLEAFYRFIRAMLHRLLLECLNKRRYQALYEEIGRKSPLEGLWESKEAGREELEAVERALRDRRFSMVLSGLRSEKEARLGKQVEFLIRRYFLFPIHYMGWIEWDDQAEEAARSLEAISRVHPLCPFSMATERLANKVLKEDRQAEEFEGKLTFKPFQELNAYEIFDVPYDTTPKDVQAAYARVLEPFMGNSAIAVGLYDQDERQMIRDRLEWAYRTLLSTGQRKRYDEDLMSEGAMEPGQRVEEYVESGGEGAQPEGEPEGEPTVDDPTSRNGRLESILEEIEAFTGEEIRRVREAQGISVEEIVSATNIRGWYIHAIEEERFPDMPETIYLKGFVKQVAQALHLDPDRVLADYMERYGRWLEENPP